MKTHRLFILIVALLAGAFMGARAQYASDGYIDTNDYDDWLHRGYRGSLYVGGGALEGFVFDVATVHGYQFNSWAFLGGGVGYNSADGTSVSEHDASFLLFADATFNLPLQSRWSPFADVQIGTAINEWNSMLRISLTVGCRFALNESLGLNLSAGYLVHTIAEEGADNMFIARIGIDLNL